ncbi:MAG: hypothetical protein M3R08_02030, partial [Bacteroidota bacterium]|nr:hypothetical protein [Bacteroidota bacterium]
MPWLTLRSMLNVNLRTAITCAAFLLIVPAFANLKKAFRALEVHDYFQARELFLKNTKKDPEAAWYGMSLISGRANNPFYHLDSAYVFIMRSDAAFTLAEASRRKKLASKFGVDHDAIEKQKAHVFEQAWEIALAANSIEAYDRYLNVYKDSPRSGEAISSRDQLAFQEVRLINTSEAYQKFISKYPHSREVYEARTRLQEAIYRESTTEGDINSYLTFLTKYPDNPYITNAQDEIYTLSTPGKSIEEYRKFIRTFP